MAADRAVFLDRDGVLNPPVLRNGRWVSPASLEEFEIYSDAAAALLSLQTAGYRLIVVTNQPDIARERLSRASLDAMHARLKQTLPLDEIRVCEHDEGQCQCRKPHPGLLLADPAIDVRRSFIVGDSWRDVGAGRRAGCRTILLDRGNAEPGDSRPDVTVTSLPEATAWILQSGGIDAVR